jgi:valyl-tRNA synthetase
MSSDNLDKGYSPRAVEAKWYAYWEKNNLFAAPEEGKRHGYSIVIPPPNVTGVLHMGHALNVTLQDILCRYRRLCGDDVLWMPGTDHAGIATQNVVERSLAAEGTDRHTIGRENFIERVWEWRQEYGSAIINQLKRLGASCDWQRERFTMDEGLSKAVRTVFVELYNQGLIYQGDYIINWCHRCHTALSDLEVEHEQHEGHLYHIRYPFADGSGAIVVATTRPETMLGDTAVAIHPDDERYRDLTPDAVILPLMEREIPIIRDPYVEMSFGTGGLKVTPAHDPNDFEIGQRHGLPSVKVIGDDGRMTGEAGRFAGMDRFQCRQAVEAALAEQGLLVKKEPHQHNVGHCYRCKEVVEPNLSKQWFVKTGPLAEKAADAVRNDQTRIVPPTWNKSYFNWLDNIRDWCISRQIWWGHRIPAWTCRACGELMVAMEAPTGCRQCQSDKLEQETDVLDTWFSSALWPFSTMGWPPATPLLKKYYPTAVLVTGFDILFFWVARMMMMGIHFMKEVPFKDVYVHALVRDKHGDKMSKSKGNVIDPLTVIDEYGTDAFRYTLAAFAAQGRDVRMDEKRVEGYRFFVNKIWNAARFALMHLQSAEVDEQPIDPDKLDLPDRWILSRLADVIDQVAGALNNYHFNVAAGTLYQFIWHELCDWYLEMIKPVLYGDAGPEQQAVTRQVMARVLRDTLVLLHPFAPFVSEEIWHRLPGTQESIMRAAFPNRSDDYGTTVARDTPVEEKMALVTGAISGVRNVRGEMNIAPSQPLEVSVHSPTAATRQVLRDQQALIVNLARCGQLHINEGGQKPHAAAAAVVADATLYVSLAGVVDFDKEIKRLEKALTKLDKETLGFAKKLENPNYVQKAPAEVVAATRERFEAAQTKQAKLTANLERIREVALEQ